MCRRQSLKKGRLLSRSLFLDIACCVSDFISIMLSYVIAVILRYRVMESDPGINALSWPYLITVMIYSFVMASVLQLMSGVNGLSGAGGTERKYRYRTDYSSYINVIISQLIGCLALLSFFYVANAIYFSRIALVLFWLISSVILIAKDMLLRSIVWKSRRNGTSKIGVLVVGTGKAAMEYIRSLICFPNYGYHLVGYLYDGDYRRNETVFLNNLDDFIIGSCGTLGGECGFNKFDNIPSDQVHCCGKYEDFERALSGELSCGEELGIIPKVDDVIFCTDDIDDETLKEMLMTARQHGINTFFASKHNQFLTSSQNIFEVGGAKLLNLKAGKQDEKNICILGLTISIAMLLLFMLMKSLNLGTSTGFNRFVSYKGLIFAISSIFLYGLISYGNGVGSAIGSIGSGNMVSTGSDSATASSKSNIFCTLSTIIAELIAIGFYECVFCMVSGTGNSEIPVGVIKNDVFMMLVAVIAMCGLSQIMTLIGRDDTGLMF